MIMTANTPIVEHREYMGEYSSVSQCLADLQEGVNIRDFDLEPENGVWFYDTTAHQFKEYINGNWQIIDKLDSSYIIHLNQAQVETDSNYILKRFTQSGAIISALNLISSYSFEERPLLIVNYRWHNRVFHNSFLVLDSMRRQNVKFYDIVTKEQIKCPLSFF